MMRLLKELIFHLGARAASVILSLLIFSVLARDFPPSKIQPVFYFGFTLGFVIATLRMALVLSAGLISSESRTQRFRRVLHGYRQALLAYFLGLPFWGYLMWRYSGSLSVTLGTALVVLPAIFDIDLLRSIFARYSSFSITFATGSILSLIYLLLWPNPSVATLCIVFTLQWIPVGLFNIAATWRRMLRHLCPPLKTPALKDLGHLPGLLLLSLFDGAVLNSPFLTMAQLKPEVGVELSIIIRIFVAALPILPLLMHWTNSGSLARVAARLHIREPFAFTLILMASGSAAGLAFLGIFRFVSHLQVSGLTFVQFLVLLGAYAVYASQMRFAGVHLPARQKFFLLGGILGIFLLVFRISAEFSGKMTYPLIMVQSSALAAAAFGLNRANSSSRLQSI